MSWGLSFDVRKITAQQSQSDRKESISEISEDRLRSLGVKLERAMRYQDRMKEEEAAQQEQRDRHMRLMMSLKDASNRIMELAVPKTNNTAKLSKEVFMKPTIRQRQKASLHSSIERMQSTNIEKARSRTKESQAAPVRKYKTVAVRERKREPQVVVNATTFVSRWVFEQGEWQRKDVLVEDRVVSSEEDDVKEKKQVVKKVQQSKDKWGWSTYKRAVTEGEYGKAIYGKAKDTDKTEPVRLSSEEKAKLNAKIAVRLSKPRIVTDKFSVPKPDYQKYVDTRDLRLHQQPPAFVARLETRRRPRVVKVECELPKPPAITIGQVNLLALPQEHKRTDKFVIPIHAPVQQIIPLEARKARNRQQIARPRTAAAMYTKRVDMTSMSTKSSTVLYEPIETTENVECLDVADIVTPDDNSNILVTPLNDDIIEHIPVSSLSPLHQATTIRQELTPEQEPEQGQLYSPKQKPVIPPPRIKPVTPPQRTIRVSTQRNIQIIDADYTMDYVQY